MFKYLSIATKVKLKNYLGISMLYQFKYKFSFKIRSMSVESNIPTTSYEIDKIRNIGIIAHIDAGKTTTTERMLFYSGVIDSPGEVHYGTTVTDYMPQERERGITIRAAAISFDWKQYQINLIDTPGHIDFTAEVERSLRVLDGAVVILDASMGVETQTITVWKQANKYNLPRIAFINKIDKAGASVENTIMAMHKRLKSKFILINYPIGEENMFNGLVDLISFKLIKFKDSLGLQNIIEDISLNTPNYKRYSKLREVMIEEIANYDEYILNKYLEGQEIYTEDILTALRKLIIQNKITIVLCGSSLRNKGVQQLLDSVVAFLPSPLDTPTVIAKRLIDNSNVEKHCSIQNSKACGIIFKIINDKEKGTISFFKIYEGILKNRSSIKYANKATLTKERITQLVRMKADECVQVNEISSGDIGAIIGLKEAKSGDTIVDETEPDICVLPGVHTPEPVFFCAISPKRNADYKPLMEILETLNREDPSVQVQFDKETSQTLICGLGELHLEIIRDRIALEHGINANLGKMKVSFRESIRKTSRANYKLDREFNGTSIYFEIELEIYPVEVEYLEINNKNDENFDISSILKDQSLHYEDPSQNSKNKDKFIFNISKYQTESIFIEKDQHNHLQLNIKHNKCKVSFDFENAPSYVNTVKLDSGEEETFKSLNQLSSENKRILFECILDSLNSGLLMGYQMVNVGVKILNGKYSTSRTNDLAVKLGITEAIKNIMKSSDPVFMEPFMLLEIVIPNYCSSQVISDLTGIRRGKIIFIICENENTGENLKLDKTKFLYEFLITDRNLINKTDNEDIINKIYALAPLTELIGYAAYLRSISKGESKFFMKFYQYDQVGHFLQEKIMDGSYFYE